MNISSIKWEGSRHAIFRFMYLQLQPFRGSLTLFYSDFKVVDEICRDLFRFLQCSHDPGCSYPQPLIIWSTMPRVGHNLWKGARPCAMWRHAQGRWANHFFAFLHFGSNAAQLPPHKRLASTFQPTIKLVIEPASAILLHSLMPALAFQWAIL